MQEGVENSLDLRRKFYTILRGETKSIAIITKHTRLVPLQSAGERTPFFMVGSYPYFIDVVKLLGTDHPVLSLIAPKAQLPQVYDVSLEATVHVRTILARQPHGPYMLGGCSVGGLVAYEAAQQLQAQGHEVGLLVLFDLTNCHLMPGSGIRALFADTRVALRRMRGSDIPRRVAEIAVAEKYRPAPYSGRMLLVKRNRGLNWRWRYLEPDFGWGKTVRGGLEICSIEAADHLEIFKSDVDRALVAQTLRRCFDEVAARSVSRLRPYEGHA
jgi:thioesterase domain-containing protein